jgi:hypothetical protein
MTICLYTNRRLRPNQAAIYLRHTGSLDHPQADFEHGLRLKLALGWLGVVLTPLHSCVSLQTQSSWIQQAEGIERRWPTALDCEQMYALTKFGADASKVSQCFRDSFRTARADRCVRQFHPFEIHVDRVGTSSEIHADRVDRACNAVVIVLRLVPKVLGSNPAFSTKHVTCLLHVE